MVGDLLLVLQHLPVELVGEDVDRRVHVGFDALRVQVLAAHVQRGFAFLLQLVDREHDGDVDDVVEVTGDAVELRRHVVAQRGRHVDMMAGQLQVHRSLLVRRNAGPQRSPSTCARWPCAG